MQTPIQITIRDGIKHSPAIEAHIKKKSEKLDHFFKNIIDCHVVIELTNKNHHHGNLHNTVITLNIPHKTLVSKYNEIENLFSSIDTAFDDITHQLEEHGELLREENRHQDTMLLGKVARLFQQDGFGFIEADGGDEYYFNANDVTHPNFHQLTVGMSVHFSGGSGTNGPQAHRVKSVGEVGKIS